MGSAAMASRIRRRFPLLVRFTLSFSLLFNARLSSAADTLSSGQSLSGNQTVISRSGVFELGFFTPGNSLNYYVGIWLKNDPQKTVVWVANRDKPLSHDTTSELKISEDCELVLLDSSKSAVWSSSWSSPPRISKSTVVAVLLDTGNLVLRDASVQSNVMWQSFDEPTDTLLAGAKIGYNKTVGKNWKLTSWKNSEDPSLGMFSIDMDPSGVTQFLLLWNRTQQYWASGPWDGNIFSYVPEMLIKDGFSYLHFSGADTNYFMYTVNSKTVIRIMRIQVDGLLRWRQMVKDTKKYLVFASFPEDPCDVYSLCGTFASCTTSDYSTSCGCLPGFSPRSLTDWNLGDQTGGCVRKTPLQCGSNTSADGRRDGFLLMSNVQPPINSRIIAAQSAEECEMACLNSCLCTAYSYLDRCSLWDGDLLDMKQLSNANRNGVRSGGLHVRLAASDLPVSSAKRRTVSGVVLGAAAGVVVLCAATTLLIWISLRKRSTGLDLGEGFLVPFRYKDLQKATKNFSERLGKGGFGSVYKGNLSDSSVVAVKKLEHLEQGDKQFRVEVSTMGAVQHVNVVRLRGFCCEGSNRLLVYDYMPNGSLDSYLFPKSSVTLDWDQRYQIALGTAKGLAYLHEKCRECIIHCDIKPENILLDEGFSPRVADFGMAKLMGRDFSRVLTTMRGTVGYVAPEWISGTPITPKADVFSFGMMLFEIVSGRRNNSRTAEDGAVSFFPSWAARNMNEVEDLDLLESSVRGHINIEEFRRACRIACWCIQEDENARPTMGEVVQMLEGTLEEKVAPTPDHLQGHTDDESAQFCHVHLHSFPTPGLSSSSDSKAHHLPALLLKTN